MKSRERIVWAMFMLAFGTHCRREHPASAPAPVQAQSVAAPTPAAVAPVVTTPAPPTPRPIPDPERYPLWGIDVSNHQHHIDWKAVAAEPHLAFAYIKATQGTTITDASFANNWKRARKAGLKVGAYHYFSFCTDGDAQAKHFLQVVPHNDDSLPPAVDLEFSFQCTDHPDPEKIRTQLRAYLARVEKVLGQRPVIYATEESFWAVLRETDLHYPIWVRAIGVTPPVWDGFPWVFWQYGDQGRLHGIEGDVDLDLFSGDAAAMELLTQNAVLAAKPDAPSAQAHP
jgi:lysozyme